jgi:hypothetical protein
MGGVSAQSLYSKSKAHLMEPIKARPNQSVILRHKPCHANLLGF